MSSAFGISKDTAEVFSDTISFGAGVLPQAKNAYKASSLKQKTIANLISDDFVKNIIEHNTQIGVLNAKKNGIAGAHNQVAFLESRAQTGARITSVKRDKHFPWIIEYEYQLPARAGNGSNVGQVVGYKKTQIKTTYEPIKISDAEIANKSSQAAKQAKSYFLKDPNKFFHDVKVDSYWFRVTRDKDGKEINNSFLNIQKGTNYD